jgi:hypothetical protein
MDGGCDGTEARDDQSALAAHARLAPLLCLDRGVTAARRGGVNATGVPSRQFAGDGSRIDGRGATARLARRRPATPPV